MMGSSALNLLEGWLTRKRPDAASRNRAGGSRLRIESLETRCLLAVFTVTNLDDAPVAMAGDAPGTLRQAIFDANDLAGADTIEFQGGLTGTLLLSAGEFVIEDSLTITGPGQGELVIGAQGASRIFRVGDRSSWPVMDLELSGMTLTGGTAEYGGAMHLSVSGSSSIVVRNLMLDGNEATDRGGGINIVLRHGMPDYEAIPVMTLESVTITNNRAQDGGGMHYVALGPTPGLGGDVTVANSFINHNVADDGGGIHAFGEGNLLVRSSVVSDNTSRAGGGGMRLALSPDPEIVESIVSGNSPDGINTPLDWGVSVTRSTIAGNSGSGVAGGSLTLTSSTLSGNGGGFGGESATVVNSTISGNGSGGRADYLTMRHSTVTGNETGGLYLSYAPGELSNSIIAGNTAGGGHDVDGRSSLLVRNSLIGDNSSSHPDGPRVQDRGGNLIGTAEMLIDPMLGPLVDNGGPTMTHALLPGSPAIDMGDPDAVVVMDEVPEFDQRGEAFARIADGDGDGVPRIDMGAFELQVAPLAGDYNGNGRVEQSDLDLVLLNWGQPFDGLPNEWTSQRPTSGIVDQAELDAVLLNWNASRDDGSASAASAVALQREPSRETRQSPSPERTSLEPDSPRERSLRPARRAAYDSDGLAHDVVHDWFGSTAGTRALRPWASSTTTRYV